MTAVESFGSRVTVALEHSGRLCVGIDPHSYILSRWELPDSASGARELGLRVIDAVHDDVGFVKPQAAFFERFGSRGFEALELVLAHARSAGLVVIGDGKRGDIGSTMEGYAHAWLREGAPFEVDALTVSPYLGVRSLQPTIDVAQAHGKGLFVLAATSNPEAGELQVSRGNDGASVASNIVNHIAALNAAEGGAMGSAGVVLGATARFAELGIDLERLAGPVRTPILAPGFGAQGVGFDEVARRFGPATPSIIVSASRALLEPGPAGIVEAVRSANGEVNG